MTCVGLAASLKAHERRETRSSLVNKLGRGADRGDALLARLERKGLRLEDV